LIIAAIVLLAAYLFIVLFLPVTSEDSSIPTLVNGITASMSIAVGLGAALLGIVFRADIEKGDYETRKTFFWALGFFIIALVYPWGSYVALANNGFQFAVRYSLGGYIIALLGIIVVYILTAKRWAIEREEKAHTKPDKSEESEQEKLKREFQHRKL
jgi:amino acid transporter